MAHRSR